MKSTQLFRLLIIVLMICISKNTTFSQGQFFMTGKKTSRETNSSPQKFTESKPKSKADSAKKDTTKRKLILGLFFSKGMKTYGDSIWKEYKKGDTTSSILDRSPTHIGLGANGEPILASELFAGLLGNWRLAFGATVVGNADSDTSKTAKSAQTFFTGGGNGFLTASLPLLHYDSDRKNGQRGRYIYAILFNPKVAGNLPKGGSSNSISDWAIDLGLEGHTQFATSNQEIGLLFKFRVAQVWGNKEYINAISTDNSFAYLQLSGGLILGKSVLLNINFSPSVSNKKGAIPSTIGVQLKF
jgi:hypothetical protein